MCASSETCKVRARAGDQRGKIPGGTIIMLQSRRKDVWQRQNKSWS